MDSNLAEVLPVEEQPAVMAPEAQELEVYVQRAAALIPTDARSLKQCAVFIEECKLAQKRVEAKRTAQVEPLNKQVKEINAVLIPVRDMFEQLWRRVDQRASQYQYELKRKLEADQRRLIDAANERQRLLDVKAEEERQKAVAARAAGNEQAAVKLEAKAEQLEHKAALVVPVVVESVAKTIDLGGATLTLKDPGKEWILPGWDKSKPIPATDDRLKGVDLTWLLRFCDVNPVRLNNAYKSGEKFPKPFSEAPKFGGSTLRGAK